MYISYEYVLDSTYCKLSDFSFSLFLLNQPYLKTHITMGQVGCETNLTEILDPNISIRGSIEDSLQLIEILQIGV